MNTYHLIYTVPFKSIDGESFVVEILEDGGSGSSVELTGGIPPFTVEINDDNFLYAPSRLSGATLKLVGSDYLQRLFSTEYQKFKVNLKKNNTIVWTGFITPEVYSQDYSNSIFELEIECVSALSTLEYIDFDTDLKSISLLQILLQCIERSKGDYSHAYIPSSYGIDLDEIYVLKSNFFDEDDKPYTLKDCLEMACTFLNWTVTEYNGSVYFIDIDYISKGGTSYIDILNNNSSSTISSSISLQNLQSMGASNTLSILGGYNKAVVIDSDYEADGDKLYPEQEWLSAGQISSTAINVNGTTYQKYYGFDSTDFIFYHYTYSNGVWISTSSTDIDVAGSFPVKTTSYSTDDIPNSLSYTNEIEIHQTDDWDGTLTNESDAVKFLFYDNTLRKVLEISEAFGENAIIVDKDYKFAINFQIARCTVADRLVYPVENFSSEEESLTLNVPFMFQIGDYYYNGSGWQTAECTFNVPVTFGNNKLCNTYVNCNDTNDFSTGLDRLNGYLINVDKTLFGSPKLTMYNPINDRVSAFVDWNARSFFIKDIELQCQKQGNAFLINENKEKEDTKYENVVNEDYINQCEDITFYITTKNDSELSFSKAIYNEEILDTIPNHIYNTNIKPEELMIQRIVEQYDSPKIKLTQEIKGDILPYSIVTDNNLTGKKFLQTGGSINYENDSANYNLIEIE